MAYKPIDNKRDQFRKYLESAGVIEVLSRSITKLMESPEKPESPVEFIRNNMGLTQKELKQIEFLKEEVEAYKKQVNDLKHEIAGLKLERQEVVDTPLKETVNDVTVKVDVVSDAQTDKLNGAESKNTEDVEPTQVLGNVTITDGTEVAEISNDVKPEPTSVEVIEEKVETKQEEIKSEEKPTAVVEAASEPIDK